MSPKSLLRHKQAISTLEDLTTGKFQPVIGEIDEIIPDQINRLVLCTGKVYYDLLETRRQQELTNVVIIRIEQLYPFPDDHFRAEIAKYSRLEKMIWCQEEPKNQGAWYQIKHRFLDLLGQNTHFEYVGRPLSAAPAEGSFTVHIEQQKSIVQSALGTNT